MIKQLHISNYALIDRLDIGFDDGLTIITGETGAGKSIILGALSLILGERADTKSIRDMSSKTVVEATFDIAEYGLQRFFEEQDIDWDDHECLVRRELSPTGRSRAFVNDTPVALSVLRELATRLLDIHSQHSNMLLSQPAFQLSILDSIAGNAGLLDDYRKTYIASYKESNTTRLRIAEHLRKLPMNFFNPKDLSELTTNMMADCSSMESLLSSTIPPLIANGITVTLTCILLMCACGCPR